MKRLLSTLVLGCMCGGLLPCRAARPAFSLPDRLYAAPGIPCAVYFASSFDTDSFRAYSFCVEGKVGRCLNDGWVWTPKPQDAGRIYTLVFQARSDFAAPVSRTVTVEVARSTSATNRLVTCALLGDSLTNARYQDRILAAMRAAGWSRFTPVGSRSGSSSAPWGHFRPNEAAHDGYGGFSPDAFLSRYALAVDEIDNLQSEAERAQLRSFGVAIPAGEQWRRALLKSPLVRLENGRRVLDVQAWLDRINKGRAPDYLIIELGVNGGCAQTAGSLVHHCDKEQVGKMRTLIAAIRAVAPETVIALCACLVGADQDAYGINYGLWPSAVQARANLFYLNSRWDRLVKELAAKGDSRIFYVPFGSAIHPVHGYIRSKEPAFAGSTTSVTRLSNALHPTLEGGCQLGDALAAFLLTHLGNAR